MNATDAFVAGTLKGRGGDVKKMRDESLLLKAKMQQLFEESKTLTDDDGSSSSSVFEFQKGCQFAFEQVMAHNDLMSGNILVNNDYDGSAPPSLTIIDYEYTCYNARAFDIGNLFCSELFESVDYSRVRRIYICCCIRERLAAFLHGCISDFCCIITLLLRACQLHFLLLLLKFNCLSSLPSTFL
jgi:hypothetical protein